MTSLVWVNPDPAEAAARYGAETTVPDWRVEPAELLRVPSPNLGRFVKRCH
jgi:hypothetical protein